MKAFRLLLLVLVTFIPVVAFTQHDHSMAPAKSAMVAVEESGIQWGDPPPVLPKGAKFAVLSGDPSKAGPFVVRMKAPAGYKFAPHWHPTDEHVTVISGTFSLGMGDTFDAAKTKAMGAGSYGLLPAEMHHFAWTKDGAEIQINGMGPFALIYVNAADDPSRPAAK